MLTLSQLTFYYWNLSPPPAKGKGVVCNWVATVSALEASSSQAPGITHTHSTSHHPSKATSWWSTTSILDVTELPDVGSDKELNFGGLSDHDETIGDEWDDAINSPLKAGVHATSSVSTPFFCHTYTKIYHGVLWKSGRWIYWRTNHVGRKLAFSNKNLPNGVHDRDHWHKHFIPTFLWWVRKQPDPWNLADDDIVDALQQVWNVLYKNIPYKVKQRDAVFAVIS